MHSIKDIKKLNKLSDKKKHSLTEFEQMLQRGVVIWIGEYIWITENEYPHKEYKRNFVVRLRSDVKFDENTQRRNYDWHGEFMKFYGLLEKIFRGYEIQTRYSLNGDTVKTRPHVHIFIRYKRKLKEKLLKKYYTLLYKLYKIWNK